ncbi:MAG: translation initiation factor IF-2 [Phycisphaerae bacterium]|nr:translation initiation factor IF-2 [Phycisphaerae bacterium]
MAKTLRVHTLAKELGVASKEIIGKCEAEGIELKNHMAAVSIGLAESIREWFSLEADVTSVEIAPSVDLDKVARPRRRTSDAEEADSGEATVDAVTEAPPTDSVEVDQAAEADEVAAPTPEPVATEVAVAPPEPETLAAEVTEVAGAADTPVAEPVAPAEEGLLAPAAKLEPGAEPAPEAPVAPADAEEKPAEPTVSPPRGPQIIAPPTQVLPPQPVMPAGPQLVPKPAELQGPRVVRIEAPERVRPPRPRSPVTPGVGEPATSGGAAGSSRKPRGRRGGKDDAEGRPHARSPRRGDGSSEAGERVREWRDQDLLERKERLASVTGLGLRSRRAAERRRQASAAATGRSPARAGDIEITTPIILKDFCATIGVPFSQVVKKLVEHSGRFMTVNEMIDAEQAEIVAIDLGISLHIEKARSALEKLQDEVAARERKQLKPRPPVVAMLGHVDHGKTSLLDRIRNSAVAKGEAGGITQHIGASRIAHGDLHVTFLDTPGHEAFTSMRARGANLTDVVVLVVAADDGVMPQTAEAIAHAKAAGVQIVVALNKIDLPGIDLNRIYSQLSEHDLTPSEWGGSTDVIKTSATTGEGIEDLLSHLATLSELMELRADPTVPAVATVIEAEMREGRGVVARVLMQEGTLKTGQTIVCGPGSGRVRSLLDPRGKTLKEAEPGTPVAVVGLDALPNAGDRLYVVSDIARAKNIAGEVARERRQQGLRTSQKAQGLEALLAGAGEAEIPVLNVIVKADVQGSVETLKQQLEEFPRDKAELRILHVAVGAVSEADVALAQASSAIIIGFHVVADDRARQLADEVGVEIRNYRVIYEILSDVHQALEGLLEPMQQEEARGTVEVRQVFHITRMGSIAGCYVTDGLIQRNHKVRLVRDGRVVVEGSNIASLRRFKEDVREVRAGFECGIRIENYDDVKPGDRIEAYEIVEVSRQL